MVGGFWKPVSDPTTTIDNYDDGLNSGWSGDTGQFANDTSTVYEGSGSVITSTAQSRVDIQSTSGLPAYLAHGERMKVYTRAAATTSSGPFEAVYWAYSDSNNWWRALLDYGDGSFDMTKYVSGSASTVSSTTVSVGSGTWYEWIITRDDGSFGGSNYDLSAELVDTSDGTSVAILTMNDSTHESADGLKHLKASLGDGDLYLDHQHKP